MNSPKPAEGSEVRPAARRMTFRKYRKTSLPTPDQSRRQSDVVRSAWRHFGQSAPMIAFLNTHHEVLAGRPLYIAIESDAGLEQVQALLRT